MATNADDVFASLRVSQAPSAAKEPRRFQNTQPSNGAVDDVFAPLRVDAGPDPRISPVDNTLGEEFTAGLGAGIDSLQGSLYGVAALTGRELGIKWMEDAGTVGAQENASEAANAFRESGSFLEIDSAGGFFKWAAATFGQAIPSLTLAMGTGGIGGSIAKKALENGIKRSVARKAERSLFKLGFSRKESIEASREFMGTPGGQKRIAEAFLNKGRAINKLKDQAFRTGSRAGVFVGSALPQIGEIDQELVNAGIVDPGLTALLGGIVGGALETIPTLRLMDKLFPGLDRQVSKQFVKDFAVATGTQLALEGSTEAAQEIVALAAHAYKDPSFDMFSPDARDRVINAFAAGALVGAVTGGGAEALGQGVSALKAAPKLAKPTIAAFTMDKKDTSGNVVEDGLPEGFVPANNTVFQEIRARVFGAVQPAIESSMNSLRNQLQPIIDSLDSNLEGGLNFETAKFTDIAQAAHNKFIEKHGQRIAEAKAYLEKQSQFIYETAEKIADPEQRAKFIEENVAAGKDKLSGLIESLRQAAAKRDQTVQAEVDNMDIGDDIFADLDLSVDPETGDVVSNPADTAEALASNLPEPGEVGSKPVLTFGKNQQTPTIKVSGKEEVTGYDSRQQAEEKGLPALRRAFPEATDTDFDIREQDDGTFVIETVNPELRVTQKFNEDFKRVRRKANKTKDERKKYQIPKRVFEGKGTKFTSPIVDIMEMAYVGLNQEGSETLQQGLEATVGEMLDRGFLDNESAQEILTQFEKNFAEEGGLTEADLQITGSFPVEGVATSEMINFINRLKARGMKIPRQMFGVRENADGTFGYGIDSPKVYRAWRTKNPEASRALQEALVNERRQDALAQESFKNKDFSGNIETLGGAINVEATTVTDPSGRKTREVNASRGDPGTARIEASQTVIEKVGDAPAAVLGGQQDFAGDTDAQFPTGDPRIQRTNRILKDTDPQADDQLTNPRTKPSEFETSDRVHDDVAQRRTRRANQNARQNSEHDNRILKRIARAGKTKVLFGLDFDGDASLTKAVKNIVTFVQNKLGLANDITVMDDVGLRLLIESGKVTDPVFTETLENPNVHARNIRVGDQSYVYLSAKILSDPVLTTLALGHELGHHLYSTAWDSLSEQGQQRLRDAYEATLPSDLASTDADFNEWMADQLAAWITQRRGPKGEVESFFAKVGGKIRRLYDFMRGRKDDRFALDQTFSDFADAVAIRAENAQSPGANPLNDAAMKQWFANNGVTMYKFWGKLPQKDDMTIPEPLTEEGRKALKRVEKNYPAIAKRAITLRNWVVNAYKVAIAPSTGVMRSIAKRAKSASKLVAIFNRAGHGEAKTSQNYHQRLNLMKAQFMEGKNGYDSIVDGLSVERRAEIARSLQTKDSNPNATFTEEEQAVRNLFDAMHAYAIEAGLPVGKVTNYFPRAFSREALIDNKQKILDYLTESTPDRQGMGLAKARSFYNSLVDQDAQDGRATFDATETPGFKNMNSRRIHDKFFDQFLDDNLDGIVSNYVNSVVKRAEFNRLLGEAMPVTELSARQAVKTGIWDPKAKMHKILSDAKDEGATDEDLVLMEKYIDANLGQLGRDDIKPGLRKFMAGVIAYQNLRVLMFTVFASLPDLAGPAIRTGDMRGTWKSLKDNMHNLANNDNDLAAMAQALGIINKTANEHIMTEYVDNHYMPPKLRQWNDAFFKWTGLNWYTDFTRKAALAVGVDYLQNMSAQMKTGTEKEQFKARDALKELGVTEEQVDAWVATGKPTYNSIAKEGDPAIAEALVQFVDESIMRPNASARPILASHPGAMLVYHLKNYLYSVHDIILKRIKFNIDESNNPAQLASAIAPAVAMMLLTAVGLELRELIQYAGSNRKPPTDRMDGWEYTWELAQRSGLTGISQLGIDFEGASDRGMSQVAGIGGPALSQFGDFLSKPATQTIPKAIPIIGQLPAARNAVRTVL